jgi:hypothetical protein
MIPKILRNHLRRNGTVKHAEEMLRRDGEYVTDLSTIEGIAKLAGMRIAADILNEEMINDGIAALEILSQLRSR